MSYFSERMTEANRSASGCVRFSKTERKAIGDDVLKVQYCWPIGKPLVRSLGGGLWEVRARLADRIARIIFCVEDRTMVLLHGFVKKSQKTPKYELDLARRRKRQLEE